MNGNRCAGPLTIDAFREMGRRSITARDFALRFGISTPMLYVCMRLQSEQRQLHTRIDDLQDEVARLKDELQRAAEERDMLRNGHRILSVTLQSMPQRKTSPRKKDAARSAGGSCSAPPHLAATPRVPPQQPGAPAPATEPLPLY